VFVEIAMITSGPAFTDCEFSDPIYLRSILLKGFCGEAKTIQAPNGNSPRTTWRLL